MYSLVLLIILSSGSIYEKEIKTNLNFAECAYLKNNSTVEINDKRMQMEISQIQLSCFRK